MCGAPHPILSSLWHCLHNFSLIAQSSLSVHFIHSNYMQYPLVFSVQPLLSFFLNQNYFHSIRAQLDYLFTLQNHAFSTPPLFLFWHTPLCYMCNPYNLCRPPTPTTPFPCSTPLSSFLTLQNTPYVLHFCHKRWHRPLNHLASPLALNVAFLALPCACPFPIPLCNILYGVQMMGWEYQKTCYTKMQQPFNNHLQMTRHPPKQILCTGQSNFINFCLNLQNESIHQN